MIQLTETEKIMLFGQKIHLIKVTKEASYPYFFHICFFVDIQVNMSSGHDISKGQRNLSKNKNLTASSKKG